MLAKKTKKANEKTEKKSTTIEIPVASLRFSPEAWAKLIYLRDIDKNEVGGFGITPIEDPLYVTDIVIPKQEVSTASVQFDDDGLINFYEDMIDYNLQPVQFSRIWIHTHPSIGANPSGTDELTFMSVFEKCDWAIMFILSKDHKYTCALQYNGIVSHRSQIDCDVDWSQPFSASQEDFDNWKAEFEKNVTEEVYITQYTDYKSVKGKGYKTYNKKADHYFESFGEGIHYDYYGDDYDQFSELEGGLEGYESANKKQIAYHEDYDLDTVPSEGEIKYLMMELQCDRGTALECWETLEVEDKEWLSASGE